jgi:hypothetical protein
MTKHVCNCCKFIINNSIYKSLDNITASTFKEDSLKSFLSFIGRKSLLKLACNNIKQQYSIINIISSNVLNNYLDKNILAMQISLLHRKQYIKNELLTTLVDKSYDYIKISYTRIEHTILDKISNISHYVWTHTLQTIFINILNDNYNSLDKLPQINHILNIISKNINSYKLNTITQIVNNIVLQYFHDNSIDINNICATDIIIYVSEYYSNQIYEYIILSSDILIMSIKMSLTRNKIDESHFLNNNLVINIYKSYIDKSINIGVNIPTHFMVITIIFHIQELYYSEIYECDNTIIKNIILYSHLIVFYNIKCILEKFNMLYFDIIECNSNGECKCGEIFKYDFKSQFRNDLYDYNDMFINLLK